ncbi:MAG: hypothetical protein ACE5J4_00430 [Candidatus Aenigmatarchaeota archaeon]
MIPKDIKKNIENMARTGELFPNEIQIELGSGRVAIMEKREIRNYGDSVFIYERRDKL